MSKLYLKKINLTGYKSFSKTETVELQEILNIVFGVRVHSFQPRLSPVKIATNQFK